MDNSTAFFLLKHGDNSIFGPVSLAQLKEWADMAMISPLDKVSPDQVEWIKAPMLADLGMDYLVQVGEQAFYGPTTLGALREFLDADEISPETPIIDTCHGGISSVADLPLPASRSEEPSDLPRAISIHDGLQDKIRELETTLAEQRRYIARLEDAYARLESELEKSV